MGKGNYASNIRKIGKSYETDLTKPNIEGEKMLTHSSASMDKPGALELFETKSSRH